MNLSLVISQGVVQSNCISWRYNNTKKKAVVQEFSISGLSVSMSIAFFIVITSALFLNFLHSSYESVISENAKLNSIAMQEKSKTTTLA